MGWFSSRQRRKHQSAGKIYEGPHRSPGFEVICHFLETEPAYAVLDLGASSTESLELLSELCDDLIVQDVFHSTEANRGVRSEIFQFENAKSASLPKKAQKFDVVLAWDLLHYFTKAERKVFVERIARRCAPNAMILIMASSIAEIPPEPIHFKALRSDRLEYCLGEERTASPGLTTRDVEQLMVGFKPVRIFQLRNGMQEMVFQIPEPPQSRPAEKTAEAKGSPTAESPDSRAPADDRGKATGSAKAGKSRGSRSRTRGRRQSKR